MKTLISILLFVSLVFSSCSDKSVSPGEDLSEKGDFTLLAIECDEAGRPLYTGTDYVYTNTLVQGRVYAFHLKGFEAGTPKYIFFEPWGISLPIINDNLYPIRTDTVTIPVNENYQLNPYQSSAIFKMHARMRYVKNGDATEYDIRSDILTMKVYGELEPTQIIFSNLEDTMKFYGHFYSTDYDMLLTDKFGGEIVLDSSEVLKGTAYAQSNYTLDTLIVRHQDLLRPEKGYVYFRAKDPTAQLTLTVNYSVRLVFHSYGRKRVQIIQKKIIYSRIG